MGVLFSKLLLLTSGIGVRSEIMELLSKLLASGTLGLLNWNPGFNAAGVARPLFSFSSLPRMAILFLVALCKSGVNSFFACPLRLLLASGARAEGVANAVLFWVLRTALRRSSLPAGA
jgi:hypothetical protein